MDMGGWMRIADEGRKPNGAWPVRLESLALFVHRSRSCSSAPRLQFLQNSIMFYSRVPCVFDSSDDVDARSSAEVESSESIESAAPFLYGKPPRPAMPRPLNITAYTRPNDYGPYIDSVLTPLARNNTMTEKEMLAALRGRRGPELFDYVTDEINRQHTNAPETWVRDVLFPRGVSGPAPPHSSDVFWNSEAWDKNLHCFRNEPQTFFEKRMEEWLNYVADMASVTYGKVTIGGRSLPPICERRSWCDHTANSLPTRKAQSKKPGLLLFDHALCSTFKDNTNMQGWGGGQSIR